MTEEKKTEKKPAPKAPKAAAATAAAKKPAAGKAAAPKAKAPKAAPSGATIKLVQIGSPIGRQKIQRATLIGLGLNKMHRERVLQDTREVRGMIEKVKHLVKVVG